ncbi:MAG TPA: methanol/ethanol family PQQ-dependent dehydrogenase [Vicinamibacterales bacterium]|nr:methanol/ethanol family PQQ-dependent dehydrogenase [Vicinamibacterales bacterium]
MEAISRRAVACAAALLLTSGCTNQRAEHTASTGAAAGGPLTGRLSAPLSALQQDDAQWVMPAKNHASTRYSGLNEINTNNISRLRVAWTFSTGVNAGHEAAPLVVGSTMYLVTPFPNFVYALDLSKPGAPVKWQYDPKPPAAARGVACCDVVNRGAAWSNGSVIFNTLDGRTIALDGETGAERWSATLADINKGESITMAPLVAADKVFVGNSGGEFGVRGWVTALNASDGSTAWRAYSTGPDRDVLIGADFKPFYDQDRGKDLGVASWPPDAWKIGGGTVWGWLSYDPELNLLYYGTGNPGPWNADQRPGDNKWTAGIFARDAQTGAAKWFYQFSPHDIYDHDGVNENLLLDLDVGGQPRKVLVHPDRNGYIYVLDRTSGEVLSATPFVHITSSKGVDLKTGKLVPVEDKKTGVGSVTRDICPSAPGAKDWQPSSFSPDTGLLYIPHNNLCMDFEGLEVSYIAGTPYVGANVVFKPGPGGHQGQLTAWDPVAGQVRWTLTEKYPAWSGTVVTAGGLVFYGTMDGWFKAVDAKSGQVAWRFKTGSGVIGQPVTYRGPDGHQYVAVFAGVGGWPGAVVVNDLDTRDDTTAGGWGVAMRDLKKDTTKGGMLYVFTVEGT